jgi:hypothetical protein
MKIAIRMLKIVTIILMIIIVFFSVTAAYSALNLKVTIGDVQFRPSTSGIIFSLPFSISNDGYYEIADLNLTTKVTSSKGEFLDLSETIISSIPKDTNVSDSHEVTIDLDDLLLLDQKSLLLEDSNFNVEIFTNLNFARAIPIQLSTNTTIPWGAPLANFSTGLFAFSNYNITHEEAIIPISFENHAILDIRGTLIIDVYNNSSERVASGITIINATSGSFYTDSVPVYASRQDGLTVTSTGNLHMIFETLVFTLEWNEPYG